MQSFKLWNTVPGMIVGGEEPVLEYYPAENNQGNGAVIICPGGGYSHSARHEGEGYALFLNSIGLDAFVLEYRVHPYTYPYPLLDARRAVRYVRFNAENFGIDKEKIAIMGSSAGGHLAIMTSLYREELSSEGIDEIDSESYIPNAGIFCYPVTDFDSHNGSYKYLYGLDRCTEDGFASFCDKLDPLKLEAENIPVSFIWHTEPDTVVKVGSTLRFVEKLHLDNVRTELHVYPEGHHGLGLAENLPAVKRWANDLEFWLEYIGFINT